MANLYWPSLNRTGHTRHYGRGGGHYFTAIKLMVLIKIKQLVTNEFVGRVYPKGIKAIA